MRHLLSRALLCALVLVPILPSQDKEKAKELRQQGQTALGQDDFDTAAKAFKQLTEIDAKDGQAWLLLGFALHSAKKLDEALPAHLKAAEFDKTKTLGLYNAACVRALQNKKDEAFQYLDQTIAAGFAQTETVEGDADMDNLRDDPRFKKALAAIAENSKKAPAGKPQAFLITTERKSARFALFGGPKVRGQLAIDYGPVRWKDSYQKSIDEHQDKSPRWRFGSDFWTTLDTNVPLSLGGVDVPVGQYYLTMQTKDGKYTLALNDPATIRKQRLDAFQAEKTAGGIEIAMEHAKSEKISTTLVIECEGDESEPTKGTLRVAFGPHVLTAKVALQTEK